MKLIALAPLILLLGTILAGCGQQECNYDGEAEAFSAKFINETSHPYYIYIYLAQFPEDLRGHERPFAPRGGSYSMAPGCENRAGEMPNPFWMRVEVREQKPNHEEIWAPERKGGTLVFEGNWTGMRCNESYVFQYNGPNDVEVFEVDSCDNRKRELERVPV